jgi:hypothetical protein
LDIVPTTKIPSSIPSVLPSEAYITRVRTVTPPSDTWFIPSSTPIPTSITATMVQHCINIVPSTSIPSSIPTYVPHTTYQVPTPSVTPTNQWTLIPSTIPTTIPSTLVSHCLQFIPSSRLVPTVPYQTPVT